jgi:Tfp pilus assembly protein PilX
MKKNYRLLKARLISEQSGQALMLVLVFLLLGSLILVPLLDQINTALKTGIKYEDRSRELYAADAGIEDGIWRIKYEGLKALYGEESYNYNFSNNATYNVENPVNGLTTTVTINNIWIPSNVTLDGLGLSSAQAMAMMDTDKLKISGTAGAVPHQPYQITINFTPATGDNLTIKSVGVWLPQGFTYVAQSCNFDNPANSSQPYYRDSVEVSEHCGGQAIVWHFDIDSAYPLFSNFPNLVTDSGNLTSSFEFSYTPPAGDPDRLPSGIAWVTTYMTDSLGAYKANDVPISWDTDTRIYKITSIAGRTRVEAYTSKLEFAGMDDASAGDYIATGNSLMGGDVTRRSILYSETSSNVTAIPSDAEATNAYLYWSAYRNEAGKVTVSTDTCSNFNNWDRSSGDLSQTRHPTGDISYSGTWDKTTNMYSYVDEEGSNDGDTTYLLHGTTAGNVLFSFPAFSVPAGSNIQNLTVTLVARDNTNGTNKMQPAIRVAGVDSLTSPSASTEVPNSYGTISYVYTTNPQTGIAWTAEDINGTSLNALQGFGVRSADANPEIRLTQVYAQVNYCESIWSISSDKFQAHGSASATTAQRTLTMKNSADLSSYLAGTTGIYWANSKSGTLESDDIMYFAFSGDGGTTWSENIEAYTGTSTIDYFTYVIPVAYQTSTFKIRFFSNLNSAAEYFLIDNIKIYQLPPDTSITFKINGEQVYLDDGVPASGAQPLTAERSQVLFNDLTGNPTGFSYACYRDVSELVKMYPIVAGENHHTGNANYTVGAVDGSTGEYISYAGWSLIIVYWSPSSAGHFFYLRDVFSYNSGTQNLDFDGDGFGGGDVEGFVIPEPIRNRYGEIIETNAAKLTCFVGEGDNAYLGDSATMTGQNGFTYALSNSSSPLNNIWNSTSPGLTCPGVDIDTFEVPWSSGILVPGDTWLHLDLPSGAINVDAWNLIYIIISVRSKTVIGATGHYIISNN